MPDLDNRDAPSVWRERLIQLVFLIALGCALWRLLGPPAEGVPMPHLAVFWWAAICVSLGIQGGKWPMLKYLAGTSGVLGLCALFISSPWALMLPFGMWIVFKSDQWEAGEKRARAAAGEDAVV